MNSNIDCAIPSIPCFEGFESYWNKNQKDSPFIKERIRKLKHWI